MNASNALAQVFADDDAKTREHFDALAGLHGGDVRAVDWGSLASQELRFSVLASMADLDGASVLDVGCGQGDLYAWLCGRGIHCEYKGIDLSPAMIALARERFPGCPFEVENLLEKPIGLERYDFVLASGIFYLRQHSPEDYLESMIERMYSLCAHGVAFNSLSTWGAPSPGEFRADPLRTLALAQRWTKRVVFRHDYHPNDFTIMLHKGGPRW